MNHIKLLALEVQSHSGLPFSLAYKIVYGLDRLECTDILNRAMKIVHELKNRDNKPYTYDW